MIVDFVNSHNTVFTGARHIQVRKLDPATEIVGFLALLSQYFTLSLAPLFFLLLSLFTSSSQCLKIYLRLLYLPI